MFRTNRTQLPMIAVQAGINHPMVFEQTELSSDHTGLGHSCMSMGGITYNLNIGDPVMGIIGDHVEPCVSCHNKTGPIENAGFHMYSCIGNVATVITGEAKGRTGYVVGKHGKIHTMVQFDVETTELLTYDDEIMVRAYGLGLQLLDYPDVVVANLDPDLLEKLNIEQRDGKLIVPVAKRIPAKLMGAGWGYEIPHVSDYDLTTVDRKALREYGLQDLRMGDLVLLEDADNTYGRGYHKGAVTIGLVIHSDSYIMGHGPGIMTLLSCKTDTIQGRIDSAANLVTYLDVKGLKLC